MLMYKVNYGFVSSIVNELFKWKSISCLFKNSDFDISIFNIINYGMYFFRY